VQWQHFAVPNNCPDQIWKIQSSIQRSWLKLSFQANLQFGVPLCLLCYTWHAVWDLPSKQHATMSKLMYMIGPLNLNIEVLELWCCVPYFIFGIKSTVFSFGVPVTRQHNNIKRQLSVEYQAINSQCYHMSNMSDVEISGTNICYQIAMIGPFCHMWLNLVPPYAVTYIIILKFFLIIQWQ